jgi:hypothetical protein
MQKWYNSMEPQKSYHSVMFRTAMFSGEAGSNTFLQLGFLVFLVNVLMYFFLGVVSFVMSAVTMYKQEKSDITAAFEYDEDYSSYVGKYESKYKVVGY